MINIDADVSQPTVRSCASIQGEKREEKREREEEDGREGRDCESRFGTDLLLNGVPLMGLFM